MQSGEAISATGNLVKGLFGRDRNEKRRRRANLNFLFKLMASVDQDADPSVIPSDDDLLATAVDAIEEAATP